MALDDDVLETFETEWQARKAMPVPKPGDQKPRMVTEKRRRGGYRRVMVRYEAGEEQRGHAVTVRFTDEEWALICRTVLASHDLQLLADDQERIDP